MKTTILLFFTMLAFICMTGASHKAQAAQETPDPGAVGGSFNTADGTNALSNVTTGAANAAFGWFSLFTNTQGSFNTGVGAGTLLSNTASSNTAVGAAALLGNTSGDQNTAVGTTALRNNSGGVANAAMGYGALAENVEGDSNTALGASALAHNITGSRNVALGIEAGILQTIGSNNIYIGFGTQGVAGENDSCYIGSIFGQTSPVGAGVLINSSGKLGTSTSSERFKDEIKPMDKASEALFALKPVTFRYKKKIDPAGTSQFGLVAEDVEKLNPDLVVRDKGGKPYSVRYDQVNAMLLNEFLKEHRKVEKLEATVAALAEQLQKVTAQVEMNNSSAQVAAIDR